MARAETRASQVLLHDKVIDLAAIRAKVEAVSREAIQEIARQAVAGPAVASAIGPKAGLRAVEAVPALFAPVIPGRA
jgi:predicted Zn-dependent peptidase